MGSAETSTTTRWIDPVADLREAREQNTREAREEAEAARLEKAEAEKAEAAALKKLAEAEVADATKKQAEEAAHHQSAIFITPRNSAPPPPEFMAQTGEAGDEHPVMERDGGDVAMPNVIVPPPPPSGSAQGEQLASLWQTSSLATRTPPIRPLKLIAKDGGRTAHRSPPTPLEPLASRS